MSKINDSFDQSNILYAEFQSCLRIRPLKKNEKDDYIVLEPDVQTKSNANGNNNTDSEKKGVSSTTTSGIALLHPVIHMASPEAAKKSRRSFGSPTASTLSSSQKQQQHQQRFTKEGEEQKFHFDHVLGIESVQDNIHYSIGLSMALDAMKPLLWTRQHQHISGSDDCRENNIIRNHLVVSMGVANTGKTYTAFGSQRALSRISSNKHEEDGLLLRIIESLFSQSQHHIVVSSACNSKNSSSRKSNGGSTNKKFAIRMSMLHIQNDRIQDMLKDHVDGSTLTETKIASSADSNNMDTVSNDNDVYANIEQSSSTQDFIVSNITEHICYNTMEARELIHSGLSKKLGSSCSGIFSGLVGKKDRHHTLVTIQPLIVKESRASPTTSTFSSTNNSSVDSSAPVPVTIKKCGNTISLLDMAGIERISTKSGRSTGGATKRDSVAANTSVASVMHCLRTIKQNMDIIQTRDDDVVCDDDADVFHDCSDFSSDDGNSETTNLKASTSKKLLKKIPFRQSKLTMLLQPIFSSSCWWNKDIISALQGRGGRLSSSSIIDNRKFKTKTVITILMTAYPGHRDYSEKKSLLSDVELLHNANDIEMQQQRNKQQIQEQQQQNQQNTYPKSAINCERSTAGENETKKVYATVIPPKRKKGSNLSTGAPLSSKHNKDIKIFTNIDSPSVVPSAPTESVVGMDDDLQSLPPPIQPLFKEEEPSFESLRSKALTEPEQLPSSRRSAASHDTTTTATIQSQPRSSTVVAKVTASPNIKPPQRTPPRYFTHSHIVPLATSSPNIQPPLNIRSLTLVSNQSPLKEDDENFIDVPQSPNPSSQLEKGALQSREKDNSSLLDSMKELREENARLSTKNKELDERCKLLQEENARLRKSLVETERKKNGDQESKSLQRLDDSRQITSLTQHRLKDAQATCDIQHKWRDTGKGHFALSFPENWNGTKF